MIKQRIFLSPPDIGQKERAYVQEAFDSNWIAPLGPHVDAFEKELSAYIGNTYTAVLSSGTAALHLALILLGVKKGDTVIAQSFTFCGSVNPVTYLGAEPVLVDSDPETWNMDPALLKKAVKELMAKDRKPKAIIYVHLYGMPAKIEEIHAIAEKYDIPVIEDAAEALGSMYRDRQVGANGDFGILSFNGNKIITTGGGGALVGKDDALIEKARFLATQARDPAPHYEHSEIGYNYRLSNVAAGIGRGQLEVLDEKVQRRREIHQVYREALAVYDFISFHDEPAGVRSNRWLTCITVEGARLQPMDLLKALEKENIEARPFWKPMHMQPVFRDALAYTNGVSEGLFGKGICLPSGSGMSDDDLERVISAIKAFLDGFRVKV